MSGEELAFFACSGLSAAALVWALRGRSVAWLWLSGVPFAWLLGAPIAAWALAAISVASVLQPAPPPAPARGENTVLVSVWPRLAFVGLLIFVLVGTWARQIVTAGVTAEEVPAFGQLDWVMRSIGEHQGPGISMWIALMAFALLVGSAWSHHRCAAEVPSGETEGN